MKIDKKTTKKIAKLSRIKLNEAEIDELSFQLSSIIDWVEELNEVYTDQIDPLNNISSSKLPLRNDNPNKVNNSDKILSNAPEKIESYFVVPKVVE